MTQDEVIEMARFAGITIDNFGFQGGFIEEFVVFSKLVAAKAIAELESQEQNFCPRCGKRTNDIHTCTPPQEKNNG